MQTEFLTGTREMNNIQTRFDATVFFSRKEMKERRSVFTCLQPVE